MTGTLLQAIRLLNIISRIIYLRDLLLLNYYIFVYTMILILNCIVAKKTVYFTIGGVQRIGNSLRYIEERRIVFIQ